VVTKLDARKITYLIKAKEERRESCANIALQLGVSRRRVESRLSRSTGNLGVGLSCLESKDERAFQSLNMESSIHSLKHMRDKNALYLEQKVEDDNGGLHINHNRIQGVLLMNSLAGKSRKKWTRRKLGEIRERHHSNSLWHTDWHEIKDGRGSG
jgi:hypothetical protein